MKCIHGRGHVCLVEVMSKTGHATMPTAPNDPFLCYVHTVCFYIECAQFRELTSDVGCKSPGVCRAHKLRRGFRESIPHFNARPAPYFVGYSTRRPW